MESMHSVWQIGIIALLAGALIGALAYRLFAPSMKQAVKDKAELDAARDELSSYKVSVNEHFQKTSELVNDLTQDYVKVYQHLAEGAHNLGDSKTFNNLLEQHPGKVSLTVDGESRVSTAETGDTIVEATTSAQAPSDFVEANAAAADSAPVEAEGAADSAPVKAEGAADSAPAEAESAAASTPADAQGDAETSPSVSSKESDSAVEPVEPVLAADSQDHAAEKQDVEATADAGGVIPESEDEPKTSRTVH